MMSEPPRKVLIIHTGGIGDLLLALPAMRLFRQAYATDILELMGRPERLSLAAWDLKAKQIHSADLGELSSYYLEGSSLPGRLSSFFAAFHAVLLFGKSLSRIFAENLKRSGVRRVILLPPFPPDRSKIHAAEYLLDSLRSAGIEGKNSDDPLQSPEGALTLARQFWPDRGREKKKPILAVHSGSGSASKNWSPGNFAGVIDWASQKARVLLISGPAEDRGREVIEALKGEVPLLLDNPPLIHLAAVLRTCSVYLGNDSGITHLAAWVGISTVAIFGPTDPRIWGPRGQQVRIIFEPESCSSRSGGKKDRSPRPCLAKIHPSSVMDVLQDLL
jgi:ADP-heptose:LPS heptosyltransferase